MNRKIVLMALLLVLVVRADDCGTKRIEKRGKQKIEIETTCDEDFKTVTEYRSGKRNGKYINYYKGFKRSESNFLNDKKHGLVQIFDSLGNVTGIEHFHNGKQVGEIRRWHSPDQLQEVIQYDSSGQKNGLWQVWWPNGNLMSESHYVANICTLTTEYYSNGNKRSAARFFKDPKKPDQRSKVVDAESWSWSGKSIARVISGNGAIIFLPRNPEDAKEKKIGMIEEYKDSVVDKRTKLDSVAIQKYK